MRALFIIFLLSGSLGYSSELEGEDEEIIKNLEFFSNLEILEDEVSLDDLEELEEADLKVVKKGQQS